MHGVIQMGDVNVPFGPGLLFTATDMPGFVLHVEICEDMFVPVHGADQPIRQPNHDRSCPDRCPAGPVGITVSDGLGV